MAIKEIARVKIHDGRISGNNFRFMPGRTGRDATDTKTVFRSLSYVRVIYDPMDASTFTVGALVGPIRQIKVEQKPGDPESVVAEQNAKVVPLASVSSLADAVPIRDYVTPEDQGKPPEQQLVKKFIDWASFQEMKLGDVRLAKYLGNRTVNVEMWTGIFEPLTEEMYQLVGNILHGSTAYVGGKTVVKAKKGIVDTTAPEGDQTIARNMARLITQEHGDLLGGVPIWSISTWEIEYSLKDSEMVLVRHFDAYYVVKVENGEELVIIMYTGSDAKKWATRFVRALSQDLAAQADKARIDAALGRQATAAA